MYSPGDLPDLGIEPGRPELLEADSLPSEPPGKSFAAAAAAAGKSFRHVPTLCDPRDCSLPVSSVHEISQARILEWVALLQGISPTQGSNWSLLHCRGILYCLKH